MKIIARRMAARLSRLLIATLVLGAFGPAGSRAATLAAQALPAQLADSTFWRLVTDYSEPSGYFRSENFLSNEITFQYVIPELQRSTSPGGAYLGVGPEQNFTYIVALRPSIAFIIDIRRQNMIEHLLYKALIERASDRADFLSLLFCRPRPPGLNDTTSAEALFTAYTLVVPDSALYRKNLAAITDVLVGRHRFSLNAADLESLAHVYNVFVEAGPDLNYNFRPGAGAPAVYGRFRHMPTYAELMQATDADSGGAHRSFLATEQNFRVLSQLERKNLVVPLVGDFAGDRAIRAVAAYLKQHGAVVTAFYTSNVEQYLFQQNEEWKTFFANVATLPTDPRSTFIRAAFNYSRTQSGMSGPRSETLLCPIDQLLRSLNEGKITSYYDVLQLSFSKPSGM